MSSPFASLDEVTTKIGRQYDELMPADMLIVQKENLVSSSIKCRLSRLKRIVSLCPHSEKSKVNTRKLSNLSSFKKSKAKTKRHEMAEIRHHVSLVCIMK